MREIKFRVWSRELNKIVYPDDRGWFDKCFIGKNGYYQTCSLDIVLKKNGTKLDVMQYTGLKDKNGKEIYEGDIVKGKAYEFRNCPPIIGEVVYDFCEYKVKAVRDGSRMKAELNTTYEVIGNIYEDGELLENSKS